jgi:hypothetical protein
MIPDVILYYFSGVISGMLFLCFAIWLFSILSKERIKKPENAVMPGNGSPSVHTDILAENQKSGLLVSPEINETAPQGIVEEGAESRLPENIRLKDRWQRKGLDQTKEIEENIKPKEKDV